MESKFFPSSTKRGFSNELDESPTAKRAKRAKNHKKRHSNGEKDSSPPVKQEDCVLIENNSGPQTPINHKSKTKKYTAQRSITPHPHKHGLRADVLELAEQDEAQLKAEDDTNEGGKDLTALISSKIQANVRMARGGKDAELKREVKRFLSNGNYIPAVAGPSIFNTEQQLAEQGGELTPLSDLAPRADYTFKAYPNPPRIQFPPFNKATEGKETNEPRNALPPRIQCPPFNKTKERKETSEPSSGLPPRIQCPPFNKHKERKEASEPLSAVAPRDNHTSKGYPNPLRIQFPSFLKTKEWKKANEPNKTNEPNQANELKQANKPKQANEPNEANKLKEASKPKKVSESKKASESKEASEPKTTGKRNKTKERKEATANPIDSTPVIEPPIADTTPMDLDASPLPSALQTPAGTKTLKAINKHLKTLTTALATNPDQASRKEEELSTLRDSITQLQTRLGLDALRASARHTILFNALIKVSSDISALSNQITEHHQQEQERDIQTSIDSTDPMMILGSDTATAAATPRGATKDKNKDSHDNNTGAGNATKDNNSNTANKEQTPRKKTHQKEARKEARDKRALRMQQARKTMEQCLRIYSEDMEKATTGEEVERYAGLVVKYAGDLFKTLG